jgi:outer membrane lipoprotein-sorting protein
MKKTDAVCALGVVACLIIPATSRSGGPTLDEVLAGYCKAREATAALKADFEQTRVFALFDEEEVSKGTFYFAQPDRVCWQYTEPDESRTVISGELGWSVFPEIEQVQKFKLAGSKTNRVLSIVGFGACGQPLSDSFDITLEKTGKRAFVLDMTPTDKDITPYFSRIELTLDRKDFLPRKIVLHEKSGDILTFGFSDLKRSVELEDSIFEYHVPEGYVVVEY